METREVNSNGVEEGNVVETEPATGEKVECESVVTILVSKGAQLVDVPDVTGQQEADAVAAIEGAKLIADVDEEDSDLPAGQVIRQSPAGGTEAKKDAVVTLVVSNGEGTVNVPNVIGQPENTAISTLRSRGAANITVVEQETEDQSQDGRVTDQAPAAGTQIRASDEVTIYVGVYVEPEEPDPDDDGDIDVQPRERGHRP